MHLSAADYLIGCATTVLVVSVLYVAVLPFFIIPMDMEADELIDDPGATVIARSDLGTVYRLDGPIATDVCAADQRP